MNKVTLKYDYKLWWGKKGNSGKKKEPLGKNILLENVKNLL